MKKILTLSVSALAGAAPITTMIACSIGSGPKLLDLGAHEFAVDPNIQDSVTRKHLIMDNFTQNDILDFMTNTQGSFDATQVSGGVGEERYFYTDAQDGQGNAIQPDPIWHMGADLIVDQGMESFAPANGEIIAMHHFQNKENKFAYGIGGSVIMDFKISDLNIDSDLKEVVYQKTFDEDFNVIDIYPFTKMNYTHDQKYYGPKQYMVKKYNDAGSLIAVDIHNTEASKSEYDSFIEIKKEEWINEFTTADTELSESDYVDSKLQQHEMGSTHVLISYMHLSDKSQDVFSPNDNLKWEGNKNDVPYDWSVNTSIDNNNRQQIYRGDLVGFVGEYNDNGGWAPHLHVNVYSYNKFNSQNLTNKIDGYVLTDDSGNTKSKEELQKTIYGYDGSEGFRPTGIIYKSHPDSEVILNEGWNRYAELKGFIDPNNIFDFYNFNDPIVNLKDFKEWV